MAVFSRATGRVLALVGIALMSGACSPQAQSGQPAAGHTRAGPTSGGQSSPREAGQASTAGSAATSPSPVAACLPKGFTVPALNVSGVPAPVAAKATKLFDAAATCDQAALVAITTKDRTRLSFGIVTPAEAFAPVTDQTDNRYRAIVRSLATRPGSDTLQGATTYYWPRLASNTGYKDPKAWQEAVDVGLITPEQSKAMQDEDTGYLGWRLMISSDGVLESQISGD